MNERTNVAGAGNIRVGHNTREQPMIESLYCCRRLSLEYMPRLAAITHAHELWSALTVSTTTDSAWWLTVLVCRCARFCDMNILNQIVPEVMWILEYHILMELTNCVLELVNHILELANHIFGTSELYFGAGESYCGAGEPYCELANHTFGTSEPCCGAAEPHFGASESYFGASESCCELANHIVELVNLIVELANHHSIMVVNQQCHRFTEGMGFILHTHI